MDPKDIVSFSLQYMDVYAVPEQYMALPERERRQRPFLQKIGNGFRTLAQISKIRVHITVEMREPILEQQKA